MSDISSPEIASALVGLQRAVTPDEIWHATHALMRAATVSRYILIGLPSLGIMPLFLRTTMPTRNIGRFAQLAPLNAVVATRPGLTVARMSDFYTATPGDPFFEEFLKPDDWLYASALLFWGEDGRFIGQLAALRSAAQGDFSKEELAFLRALHPQVNAAITRLLILENAAATQVSLEHSLHALPLPIVIVNWDLAIAFTNTAAGETIHRWRHSTSASHALKPCPGLPAEVDAACGALKADWNDAVLTHDFSRLDRTVLVMHPEVAGLSAAVRLVESPAGRTLHPSFIIHFTSLSSPAAEVAQALARFTLLSPAERTVAILAAEGHDNADISRRLNRSLSTVRTHLRSVFRKLGISSRARLAPLLHGLKH